MVNNLHMSVNSSLINALISVRDSLDVFCQLWGYCWKMLKSRRRSETEMTINWNVDNMFDMVTTCLLGLQ